MSSDDCSYFYSCDTTMMKCVLEPGLGKPCPDDTCSDAGTYCDQDTEMCAATKPAGSACGDDEECQGADCVNSVCAPVVSCL